MVVENVETLDVGWCVYVGGGVPPRAAGSLPGLFGRFDTHETQPLGSN